MSWNSPPVLAGCHLRLDPLQAGDGPALLAAAADGELWKLWYTSVPGPDSIDAYVAKALSDREAGTAMPFTVRDPAGALPQTFV